MVFSSTVFLFAFLPVVLGLYYICPLRFRNALLLAASLLFYAWGEPKYIVIMALSILFNYCCGLIIDKQNREHKSARLMLAFSVAGNLMALAFFKYTDFAIENINRLMGSSFGFLGLALPIGISFYTFQAMSYVIDVYRGKTESQRNLLNFALYVSLFPQLIAGPIVRYVSIQEQLGNRCCNIEKTADGIRRFIIGLGKKVLLANQAGMLWNQIQGMDLNTLPAATAWLGAIAFTFQIYFDFSGYSDMAIGLGKMFGFDFDENFNYPYISKSITEFWRRWHISLSTWFKEYVYIPLGGNRKGIGRQIVNIMIVWALTGLWHGASWNFMLWGVYFGVILILEKVFLLKVLDRLPGFVRHLYALILIVFGWVIFSNTDAASLFGFIHACFGANMFADGRTLYLIGTNFLMLIIMAVGSTSIPVKAAERMSNCLKGRPVTLLVLKNLFFGVILILSVSFIVSGTYNPFLYFRF